MLLFYAIVLLFENCTCIWYMYKHGSFLRADFKFKHICGVIDLIIFQNLGLYLQCIHSEYMTCELKSGNSQSASFTNSFISIKQLWSCCIAKLKFRVLCIHERKREIEKKIEREREIPILLSEKDNPLMLSILLLLYRTC